MSQLAVQMYTVRDFTKTANDLAESFRKIAQIGYVAVQLSAVGAMNAIDSESPEVDVTLAKKMLDDNGLRCIATHRSWSQLAEKTDEEIEFHQTLACDFVAIGGIPAGYDRDSADDYHRFVAEAQPVIAKLKSAGIRFGHHNHAHEFQRISPDSPRTLWDIVIEEGGADYYLENDLYWAWHAGVDPADLMRRCAGRAPVIHLKDREVVKEGPVMAAIGEGNMPWERILTACREAGTEWYAVEQDVCRRDPFDCLRSSFDYLTSKGL